MPKHKSKWIQEMGAQNLTTNEAIKASKTQKLKYIKIDLLLLLRLWVYDFFFDVDS